MPVLLALFVTAPVLAAPHSGVVHQRTAPELSDIALFVLACAGVWLIRRAMRARFARRRASEHRES